MQWTVMLSRGGIDYPAGPDEFRYWDGNEWTAHATVPDREIGRSIQERPTR